MITYPHSPACSKLPIILATKSKTHSLRTTTLHVFPLYDSLLHSFEHQDLVLVSIFTFALSLSILSTLDNVSLYWIKIKKIELRMLRKSRFSDELQQRSAVKKKKEGGKA